MPAWREVDFEPRRDRLPAREAWRQDLFEEVWRQAGLDTIPATLPALGGVDSGLNAEHDRRDRLRDRLAGFGYAEAIHYAFGERRADSAFPRLVGDGRSDRARQPAVRALRRDAAIAGARIWWRRRSSTPTAARALCGSSNRGTSSRAAGIPKSRPSRW